MRWRDLLPWRSFVFETSWSPSTAVVEIKKRVGPRRWWPQRSDSPFVGASTGEYTFKFRRKISYRNPSLPVVCVVVQPAAHVREQARRAACRSAGPQRANEEADSQTAADGRKQSALGIFTREVAKF